MQCFCEHFLSSFSLVIQPYLSISSFYAALSALIAEYFQTLPIKLCASKVCWGKV